MFITERAASVAMNAEWTTRRCGERTLVEVTLTSDRPRRVRVEPADEQPFQPPRTDGLPDAGWDDEGYTGVVDGRLGLGFAVTGRVDTDDRPVRIEWRGRPASDPTFDGHPDVPDVTATTDGVVRTLSDPRPPRDAVPREREGERVTKPAEPTEPTELTKPAEPTESTEQTDVTATERAGSTATAATPQRETTSDGTERVESEDHARPNRTAELDVGLAALERRVALAERLTAVETLDEASEAVAVAGGLDGVRALDEALVADRERLDRLVERVVALRDRAEAVAVPTETLARIGGETP